MKRPTKVRYIRNDGTDSRTDAAAYIARNANRAATPVNAQITNLFGGYTPRAGLLTEIRKPSSQPPSQSTVNPRPVIVDTEMRDPQVSGCAPSDSEEEPGIVGATPPRHSQPTSSKSPNHGVSTKCNQPPSEIGGKRKDIMSVPSSTTKDLADGGRALSEIFALRMPSYGSLEPEPVQKQHSHKAPSAASAEDTDEGSSSDSDGLSKLRQEHAALQRKKEELGQQQKKEIARDTTPIPHPRPLKTKPKTDKEWSNQLKARVCTHAQELLKVKSSRMGDCRGKVWTKLPDPPVDPDNTPLVTTTKGFTMAWSHSKAHVYNKMVMDVFTKSFITKWSDDYSDANYRDVYHAIETYFLTLAKMYKAQAQPAVPEQVATEAALTKNSRSRRRRLFEIRKEMVSAHPDLNHFLPVLDALTTRGMSSDDEEVEVGGGSTTRYMIAQRPWRSSSVKSLVRTLSLLHAILIPRDPRGGAPRLREDDFSKISQSPPVSGLPLNFYDKEWYDALSDFERYLLGAKPNVDLTIPEVFLEVLKKTQGNQAS
ncbi:hypothetical protein FRB99_003186 [Tulasnella sp. 403]|nr:hypothetical protein FRB99_003186 [Tulasnella sp. 403]